MLLRDRAPTWHETELHPDVNMNCNLRRNAEANKVNGLTGNEAKVWFGHETLKWNMPLWNCGAWSENIVVLNLVEDVLKCCTVWHSEMKYDLLCMSALK